MRRHWIAVGLATCLGLGSSVLLASSGGITSASFTDAATACASCHEQTTSPASTTTFGFSSFDNNSGTFGTYTFSVSVSRADGNSTGGFNANTASGTISAGTNSKVLNNFLTGLDEATHDGTGARSWTFTWQPASLVTQSSSNTFNVCAQGVNNNGASSGDRYDCDSQTAETLIDPPTANAGTDQNVDESDFVTLSGSRVAGTGSGAITYAWTQVSGTAVTLSSASAASPTFTAPTIASTSTASTTLVFGLTINDSRGRSAQDTVSITVNNRPEASAGPDQSVNEGAAVTLTSAASCDGNGATCNTGGIVSRLWSQTAGTTVSLSSTSATSPTFTAPNTNNPVQVLTFEVLVTDASGATDTDTVDITVDDVSPTANAGTDQNVNEGVGVTLNGSGSSDALSGAITYAWSQTGGTAVTLSSSSASSPTFTAPTIVSSATASDTLTFDLTVTDAASQQSTDSVSIVVNNGPVADAGIDQTVTENTGVTLDGSQSRDAGAAAGVGVSYSWTQMSGTSVTLSGSTTSGPTFTAPNVPTLSGTLSLTFRVTVQDAGGLTATDDIVVTVNDIAVGHAAPVASAGSDASVNEGVTGVVLSGSATDADSTQGQLTFAWTQTGGTAVVLSSASAAQPTFTAPSIASANTASEDLTFQLSVTDEVFLNSTDTVVVSVNNGPVANAGSDQTVAENSGVTLVGGQSRDAGAAAGVGVSYQWQQIPTSTVALSSSTDASPTFTAHDVVAVGGSDILTFELTVTDAGGLTATDTVSVTVNDAAVGALPPSATLTPVGVVAEGDLVNLSGMVTDGDTASNLLTYQWTQTAGPTVTINDATSLDASFTAPTIASSSQATETLIFSFTVTDDVALTDTESVSVTVNNLPTADAGSDQSVNEAQVVSLDASGSADPGGGALTYLWTQTGGSPTVTLSGAATASPSFTAPDLAVAATTLTFRITATDTLGGTATDEMTVTIDDQGPTADAGADREENEGVLVTLLGSGIDARNDPLTYLWTQTAGTAVVLSGATTTTPSFTAPTIADTATENQQLSFSLTVTDDVGNSASDNLDVVINNGPNADAGADATVTEGDTVNLSGAASFDSGRSPGDGITYSWARVSGPTITLSGDNTATPNFIAPSVATVAATETLMLRLTVTDAGGLTSTDDVTITINDIAVGKQSPTVDAGGNRVVNEGVAITLTATATDADSTPQQLTYVWQQISGTNATLGGDDTATLSISPITIADAQGASEVLTFRVTVTDEVNLTATADITLTVNNGPTADAGADVSVDEDTSVNLSGAASFDADGIITYAWTQVSGPAVSIQNETNPSASFTAPEVGIVGNTVVVRLTVTDDGPDGGLTSTDDLVVTVNNVNAAPSADAGDDASVNEGDAVTLDGSGSSDPDDTVATYVWTQLSGPSVVLLDENTSQASFVAPAVTQSGSALTFQLLTADAQGLQDSDQVVITVLNVNQAPVASAGVDQQVSEGATVVLSGENSADDEGLLLFNWQQTDGTAVTLIDVETSMPSFVAPDTGILGEGLAFTVRVTDQEGLTDEDSVIVNISDVNRAPISTAGADQSVAEGQLVTLDGSNSADPDAPLGEIVSYVWTQVEGPAINLSDTNTTQPTFVSPLVGRDGEALSFRLRVTDDAGAMADDEVLINVDNLNQSPVAIAGADQSVLEGVTVELNGLNSFDADGPIADYQWSQVAGPNVVLSNPLAAQPTFVAPRLDEGMTLTFELRATDLDGAAATDRVNINVIDIGGLAPQADAGPDQTVMESVLVQLDAGGSSDGDGTIVSYRWRQMSGVSATLSDPLLANPELVAPIVDAAGASLSFEVTVTDDDGLSSSDTVIVAVTNSRMAPSANAGVDQNVEEGETVTLDGTASSNLNGSIVAYTWTQISGPSVTLSDAGVVAPTFVAPAVTTDTMLVFEINVTNDDDLISSDQMVLTVNDNGITGFSPEAITFRSINNEPMAIDVGGGELTVLAPVDAATISDQRGRPASLPLGLLNLRLRVPVGGEASVVVFLSEPAPANARYVKYQPNLGWIDFSSNATFSEDRRQVTVRLVDGGAGDDDGVANGEIIDPSGVAVYERTSGTPDANNGGFAASDSSSGRFGCSLGRGDGRVDGTLLLLLLLAFYHLVSSRWRIARQ